MQQWFSMVPVFKRKDKLHLYAYIVLIYKSTSLLNKFLYTAEVVTIRDTYYSLAPL